MNIKTIYAAAATLTLLAAGGCKEDEISISDSITRPINVAAPLVKSESTAKSLAEKWLDGTTWEVDDNGILRLVYLSKDSATAADALRLSDATFGADAYATPDETQATFRTTIWDTEEGQRIDQLTLNGGTLSFYCAATQSAGKARLTVQDKNGTVRNAAGSELATEWDLADGTSQSVDMAGYIVSPLETSDGHWYVNVVVTLSGISSTTPVSLSGSMTGMKVAEAVGYFGNHYVINDHTTVRVTAFDRNKFPDGVEFKGSFVDIDVSSTIGAPLKWKMSDIVYTGKNDKKTTLDYNPGVIEFTQQSYSDYLATKTLTPQTRSFHIDETNSNIYDAVNSHSAIYEFSETLEANPDGKADGKVNFVTSESAFSAQVRTTIPFRVRVTDLTYDETLDLDFRDLFEDENIDYVDSIRIRIVTDNGLPLKARAQGYFTADGESVGQLFDEPEIICETAQLDANDIVTASTHKETTRTLTHDEVRKYYDLGVDKIAFHSIVTTEDTGDRFVDIYAKYTLDWKVTMVIYSSAKD